MSQQEEKNILRNLLNPHTRRDFMKRAGTLSISAGTLAAFLEACGSNAATTTASTAGVNMAGPIDMKTLISKTKSEGKLQAIGVPPEWANYSEMLAGYTRNFVPVEYKAESEFSSAQEIQVFVNSKQHSHGDIADVGFVWGPKAISQGLVSPYKHSYWNDIPANLKDPNGNWCVEYWGAMAFVVNTDIVKNPPTSFAELLTGNYKNMVGIDGDPRQATDAMMAVYSAALATAGSTSSIQPGIDYFAKLKKSGNFTSARASIANMTKGEVAIAVIWDYLGLGFRDQLAGKPHLTVSIPTDGSLAGTYILIINKTAPDPFAARLWSEYLFSDEGQLDFLRGYAHPVRYNVLQAAGKIPADLAAKLPSSEQYTKVQFVTDIDALTNATNTLNQNWQSQVLGQ